MTKRSTRNRWGIGVILAAALVISVWIFISATPGVVTGTTLDDQTLETKALEWARTHGLQSSPLAKRSVRMTLGQWVTLNGGQLLPGATQLFGIDQSTPVFALAIRGNVMWRGLGGGMSGRKDPERFDNIIIVLDARNGQLVAATAARTLSEMPIQVPLNTLTPAPTVNFVLTRPPVAPPTLALKATPTKTPLPSFLATPTASALR